MRHVIPNLVPTTRCGSRGGTYLKMASYIRSGRLNHSRVTVKQTRRAASAARDPPPPATTTARGATTFSGRSVMFRTVT